MSELIGKPLDEIRDLERDIDELSGRELCYIVALGIGQVSDNGDICKYEGTPFWDNKGGEFAPSKIREVFVWPDYTSSWEHAGRVLGLLSTKPKLEVSINGGKGTEKVDLMVVEHPIEQFKVHSYGVPRSAITKAAAKCVLAGIALEVSG